MTHSHLHANMHQGVQPISDFAIQSRQRQRKLKLVLGVTFSFLVVEVIFSFITHSLALLSDAGHMLTDVFALIIAIIASRIASRPADTVLTYGYQRFEVLAPIVNSVLLLVIAVYIFIGAMMRLYAPEVINAKPMLIVACLGLVVNLISLYILHDAKHSSANLRAVYLEVMADMLSSVGVIIAAICIYVWHISWVDTLVAVGIALWVLPRTWLLLRENVHILLESAPKQIDVEHLYTRLTTIPLVAGVHDLHVWSVTENQVALTVHLLVPQGDKQQVLEAAMYMLATEFAIHHVTIQCERVECPQVRAEHEQYSA